MEKDATKKDTETSSEGGCMMNAINRILYKLIQL